MTANDIIMFGFQLCDFNDVTCESCNKQNKIIYFMQDDFGCNKGRHSCASCAIAEINYHDNMYINASNRVDIGKEF